MRRLGALVLFVVGSTTLAASGGPASGAQQVATVRAMPWVQEPTLPTLPADVRARGRWVIGVKCDFPPFGYVNPRGEKAGFEAEIARRFAALAFGSRTRLDLVCVTTPNRFSMLLNRTVDIIVASLTYTKLRADIVDYSIPYYGAGGRLAVLVDSGIKKIGDLAGKTAVTTRGSVYDRWMATCLPATQKLTTDSTAAAVAALKERRAHAYIFDEALLLNTIATEPAIELTQDSFLTIPWGIGVRKGEPATLQWVNAALQYMTRKDEFFPLLRANIPPVVVGDVPRPGRPALAYPGDADPFSNCTTITMPPRETVAVKPKTKAKPKTKPKAKPNAKPNPRGVATGSLRPLRKCPVCGFQATFVFTQLPARGSKLTAVWYYNKVRQGDISKPVAKKVTTAIEWAGPAPRGFHWCDLVVQAPGKRAATVARAVIRRR